MPTDFLREKREIVFLTKGGPDDFLLFLACINGPRYLFIWDAEVKFTEWQTNSMDCGPICTHIPNEHGGSVRYSFCDNPGNGIICVKDCKVGKLTGIEFRDKLQSSENRKFSLVLNQRCGIVLSCDALIPINDNFFEKN